MEITLICRTLTGEVFRSLPHSLAVPRIGEHIELGGKYKVVGVTHNLAAGRILVFCVEEEDLK